MSFALPLSLLFVHRMLIFYSFPKGRRLYIGNLAYATTEGELKTFFKDFLVYVFFSICNAIN